jgi:hypothetical protein
MTGVSRNPAGPFGRGRPVGPVWTILSTPSRPPDARSSLARSPRPTARLRAPGCIDRPCRREHVPSPCPVARGRRRPGPPPAREGRPSDRRERGRRLGRSEACGRGAVWCGYSASSAAGSSPVVTHRATIPGRHTPSDDPRSSHTERRSPVVTHRATIPGRHTPSDDRRKPRVQTLGRLRRVARARRSGRRVRNEYRSRPGRFSRVERPAEANERVHGGQVHGSRRPGVPSTVFRGVIPTRTRGDHGSSPVSVATSGGRIAGTRARVQFRRHPTAVINPMATNGPAWTSSSTGR